MAKNVEYNGCSFNISIYLTFYYLITFIISSALHKSTHIKNKSFLFVTIYSALLPYQDPNSHTTFTFTFKTLSISSLFPCPNQLR